MNRDSASPYKCIIVGAGHGGMAYGDYAHAAPDRMQIVAVADPNPTRRQLAAERFGLSTDQCFETADQVAAQPKFADFVINGTMDHQHLPTTLPWRSDMTCCLRGRSGGVAGCHS